MSSETVPSRFAKLLSGEMPSDRLPIIEWATWWDLTLAAWRRQGLPEDWDGGRIKTGLGLDLDLQYWFPNLSSDLPGPVASEKDYEAVLPVLYPDPVPINLSRYAEAVQKQADGLAVCWLTVAGFFWWPRVLMGIEPHLLAFYDEPVLMERMIRDQTRYALRCLETAFAVGKPTFITLAEDMSYNNGPMLSKQSFERFLAPAYREVASFLQRHKVPLIVDTDGDPTLMLPWLIEVGVNGVLPLERQAGVDLDRLLRDFPQLVFVGGFDKMAMRSGVGAMRDEFRRLESAMRSGRYIPSVDHQTPPDVDLATYKAYLKMLRESSEAAVRP